MSSRSFTDTVADFIVSAAEIVGTPQHRAAATRTLIDTVGVVMAGRHSEVGPPLGRWLDLTRPAGGSAGWNGVPAGTPAETAALIAATFGHALDFDDVLPGCGHPSNTLYAATLAVGADLSGARMLDAFLVGYEVNARLSRAVGHKHYLRGWHTSGTIGTFGAAAAAAVAIGLAETQVRMALGIAASLAGGIQRNFGSMTKPLHAGFAAHHGVWAAQLAACGLTAQDQIFDGPRNFFDIYSDGGFRPDALDGLGLRWAITSPGPTLKAYAAALEVYRAVEGTIAAMAQLDCPVEAVASIDCGLPPGTTGPLLYDRPRNGIQAKFSLPYTVAAAAVSGGLTLDDFTDAAVRRSQVERLMEKIHYVEDLRYRPQDPSGRNSSASFGGFVEVSLTDRAGRSATVRIDDVLGSPGRPLSTEQLRDKFTMCLAAAGHTRAESAAAFERLETIRGADHVGSVLADLTNKEST